MALTFESRTYHDGGLVAANERQLYRMIHE